MRHRQTNQSLLCSRHNHPRQLRQRLGCGTRCRIQDRQHHQLRLRAGLTHIRALLLANPPNDDQLRQATRRLRHPIDHQHRLPIPNVGVRFRMGEQLRRDLALELHLRARPTILALRLHLHRAILQPPPHDEPFPILYRPGDPGHRVPERKLRVDRERPIRRHR